MPLIPKGTNPLVQLPEVLAVGFTGHRKVPYETKSRQVIRDFLARQKDSHHGVMYGVSSAASGADQLFAESCLELNIPLRVLLPRPADLFRADFDDASWLRTVRIMENAISIEVTGKHEAQNEQYYDCGIQTVAESQLLVALWDGQPSRGVGGTQEIVSYARKTGHPIAWIHSETGVLQFLNKEALKLIDTSSELEFLNGLPDLGPNASVAPSGRSSRDLAQAWLDKADGNANRFAPQARRVASVPIVYTAAAAVMAGVAPEIPGAAPWLGISAVLGIFSLAMPAVLRLHARQALWARTRTAAEIARSVLVTWGTPRPYEVIGAEVAPWLSGILRSLNFLKMEGNHGVETPLSDFKQEYRRDRVAHQIEYFSRQARKAERQERRYAALGWVCGGLATLIAVACLSGGLQWLVDHGFSGRQWLAFAMSALFEVATMAGAFAAMKDCARRRRRYREISHALRRWDAQLEALNTWNSVLRVVERIERALIVELFEWRSLVLGAASHKG
ncbi:MAG TPA: hypothetical protein VJX73_02515 [Terracidiphilus sp.]|nr:hypothetical protein [Terracidiphilus sp.]